eukprot:g4890.t1
MISALAHLHEKGFIYRDLKPENILIDNGGYIRLIDFGFSKYLPDGKKTSTFCGTPDYLSPEIVLSKGHNRASDYWALGIFIFELLCRRTPFEDERTGNIFKKIIAAANHLKFQPGFSLDARSLICQLMNPNPGMRLGMLHAGINDIKNHRWFGGIDWTELVKMKYKTPYVPLVSGRLDASSFDIYSENLNDRNKGFKGDQSQFSIFS